MSLNDAERFNRLGVERGLRHSWGYGCGSCPACELRAKGFAAYEAGRDAL